MKIRGQRTVPCVSILDVDENEVKIRAGDLNMLFQDPRF